MDVKQASGALQAIDEVIKELSGRTDRGSINQLIRLLELKQSLLGKGKDMEEVHIVWGKGLEKPRFYW